MGTSTFNILIGETYGQLEGDVDPLEGHHDRLEGGHDHAECGDELQSSGTRRRDSSSWWLVAMINMAPPAL